MPKIRPLFLLLLLLLPSFLLCTFVALSQAGQSLLLRTEPMFCCAASTVGRVGDGGYAI
jgi:hypothetical protein